jgi:hypothetical protein
MIPKYRNTGASIPVFRYLQKHEVISQFYEKKIGKNRATKFFTGKKIIFLQKTEKLIGIFL